MPHFEKLFTTFEINLDSDFKCSDSVSPITKGQRRGTFSVLLKRQLTQQINNFYIITLQKKNMVRQISSEKATRKLVKSNVVTFAQALNEEIQYYKR